MSFIDRFFNTTSVSGSQRKVAEDNYLLSIQVAALQASIEALTGLDERRNRYTGNPYIDYTEKVDAIIKKYMGEDDWGCGLTKNIIDVRTAFIVGGGLKVTIKDSGDREREFVSKFISDNKLDTDFHRVLATSGELEGKCLVALEVGESKTVLIKHYPWNIYRYTVTADSNNPTVYAKVDYEGTGDRKPFHLQKGEFVYTRFNGVIGDVNKTPSKTTSVLRYIEDLDKNAADWRKINHLYASPTPDFEVLDKSEAKELQEHINSTNWRIGKAIVHTGKFTLVSHMGDGYTTLKEEASNLVVNISGATGVPPHFLGATHLMANRSTAESLMELIVSSTDAERLTWGEFYTNAIRSAMNLYNVRFNNNLNPEIVKAEMVFVNSSKLDELTRIWLPMYMGGAMSLKTLLSKIPHVDAEKELAEIDADVKAGRRVGNLDTGMSNGDKPRNLVNGGRGGGSDNGED